MSHLQPGTQQQAGLREGPPHVDNTNGPAQLVLTKKNPGPRPLRQLRAGGQAAPAPTLDPNMPKFGYSPAARARCLCKPREPQVHSGGPLLSAPARPAALRRCIAGPPPRRTLRPVACCKRAPTPRFSAPSPASSASWPVELHAAACCWQWVATHLGVLFSWSSFRPYSCSSRSASARFRRKGSGDG